MIAGRMLLVGHVGDRAHAGRVCERSRESLDHCDATWCVPLKHVRRTRDLAGFVLANGSMSSNTSGEGQIRQRIIEADLVHCMVALPGQLFFSTQSPVCPWLIESARLEKESGEPAAAWLRVVA